MFYKFYECGKAARTVIALGTIVVVQLCIAYVVSSDFSPFLYFRF